MIVRFKKKYELGELGLKHWQNCLGGKGDEAELKC